MRCKCKAIRSKISSHIFRDVLLYSQSFNWLLESVIDKYVLLLLLSPIIIAFTNNAGDSAEAGTQYQCMYLDYVCVYSMHNEEREQLPLFTYCLGVVCVMVKCIRGVFHLFFSFFASTAVAAAAATVDASAAAAIFVIVSNDDMEKATDP